MRVTNITAACLVCVAIATPTFADEPAASDNPAPAAEPAREAGPTFKYQTGDIVLPNKAATLHLGTRYRYLDAAETNKLIVAWGNPADNSTQGAIVPADVDPMGEQGWAVILTYSNEGHIDDSDAAKIDYDDLLKDMKKGMEDANDERKTAGYAPLHLVGWAEAPHYDAATKKLYWAKELRADGGAVNGLNYDVRVLGREGVLEMQAVAGMPQLSQIRADMRPLIQVAEFNPGYRYAEFNKKTDRLAEYGLGALIAGGVAAKLGLFGKLFAVLLAAKKVIIAGVIAIGGYIARLFGKKKDATS